MYNHPVVAVVLVIIGILGIVLIVWSSIEDLGMPIEGTTTHIGERPALLKCIVAKQDGDYYRFIVSDKGRERFYKIPIDIVVEKIDPDKFFRRNSLEIQMGKV